MILGEIKSNRFFLDISKETGRQVNQPPMSLSGICAARNTPGAHSKVLVLTAFCSRTEQNSDPDVRIPFEIELYSEITHTVVLVSK